jgi:hypothetical protein
MVMRHLFSRVRELAAKAFVRRADAACGSLWQSRCWIEYDGPAALAATVFNRSRKD